MKVVVFSLVFFVFGVTGKQGVEDDRIRQILLNSTHNRVQNDKLNIHVTTFNTGAIYPNQKSLKDWINNGLDDENPHELVVFGLQETVELKFPYTLGSGIKNLNWLLAIKKAMQKNYKEVDHIAMIGIFLIIFQKRDNPGFAITEIKKDTVATGEIIKGIKYGNKGGVGISITLKDQRIAFVNCHLAPHEGQKNADMRAANFQTIRNSLKFFESNPNNYGGHDVVIWMGDTNSRLNHVNYEDGKKAVDENTHATLVQHDQLQASQADNKAFVDFVEGPLSFPPTFKYDVGTSDVDTSKKSRVPAWCDRILHWRKDDSIEIEQLNYDSLHHITLSDHKPVKTDIRLKVPGFCKSGSCSDRKFVANDVSERLTTPQKPNKLRKKNPSLKAARDVPNGRMAAVGA